ncbi:MarR family winged helix-turn-helix transcriptional regulator [Corynebacterium glyciniphilum]|uniref:MarR family winged helix-turn-helix transcriptional regulator n=1 Tax=Corynebacterium glyciniphilum TaxID=1404244 RepID=UPI0021B17BD7|nr:MarR family transcriptional regulator [Corynebacterium glyciniphilum]
MHAHTLRRSEINVPGNISEAWSQVAAFASAVDASLDKWLGDNYRLGLTEYRALTHLSQSPDKELRIAVLAQSVGLTSTSTTRLVSRLEAKGHARRDVCQDDGRGVYAVIDQPGETLLSEVREPFAARMQDLLSEPKKHFPHLEVNSVASSLAEVNALLTP